jgi:hypothetical protein
MSPRLRRAVPAHRAGRQGSKRRTETAPLELSVQIAEMADDHQACSRQALAIQALANFVAERRVAGDA